MNVYYPTQLMQVDIYFTETDDIHDRPGFLEYNPTLGCVSYHFLDAAFQPAVTILDYRPRVIKEFQNAGRIDRLNQQDMDILRGEARASYKVKEIIGESGKVVQQTLMRQTIVLYQFDDLKASEGVLMHVAHGRVRMGSPVSSVSPNGRSSHAAVTVITSRRYPAVIEQTPCVHGSVSSHFLFMNEQVHERSIDQFNPEDEEYADNVMSNFLKYGKLPIELQ